MIKIELYKLLKMKVVWLALFFVLGTVIYSMVVYGEFGYDVSNSQIAYSEKNGELLLGHAGYEQNKAIATKYSGEVNDKFLERLHQDYNVSSYAEMGNIKIYNSTYSFFQDIFYIQYHNYTEKDAVWGNVDGTVQYGFTGDWDAYGHILGNFFNSFTIFIIVFSVPIFTYERECGVVDLLGTAKNGGKQLFKYKVEVALLVVNIVMFIMLAIISVIHFLNYGFENADVSIQCSFEKKFVGSVLNCTMAQLTICRLLFGIIGCNMILLETILIAILSKTSLTGFALSLVVIWVGSYPIVHYIVNNYIWDLILMILPVNALYITTLIREIPAWNGLYGVLGILLVWYVLMFIVITKVWRTKLFFAKRD